MSSNDNALHSNMEDLCIAHRPAEVYREVDWIRGFEGLVAVSNHGNVARLKTGKVVVLKPNNHGYICIHLWKDGKQKQVSVHSLVAHAFIRNPDPTTKTEIDHVNKVKSENAVWNLRWVTRSENMRNKVKLSGTSSKYIGVCWDSSRNKWMSYARVDNKTHTVGRYDTEEEAAHARDDWVRENGGSCWQYNFPV